MKPVNNAIVILCIIIFISCTKTAGKKAPPPAADTWTKFTVPTQPELKIKRLTSTFVYPDGSGFDRTTEFEYDRLNRLTSIRNVENNLVGSRYVYSGNELVAEIVQDDLPNAAVRYDTSIRFSRTGDTVILKYDYEDRDLQLTYYFKDSLLSEYIYFEKQTNSADEHIQTNTWLYASDGNLRERRIAVAGSPPETYYSVWETDNQPNVFRHVSRFLQWSWPGGIISGMSRNNVTQIRTSQGAEVRFNYTYNTAGYPTTITSSRPSDFPNLKIEYVD